MISHLAPVAKVSAIITHISGKLGAGTNEGLLCSSAAAGAYRAGPEAPEQQFVFQTLTA